MPEVRRGVADLGGENDLAIIDRGLRVEGLAGRRAWVRITRESGSDRLITPSRSSGGT